MAQVVVTSERQLGVSADAAYAALADYEQTRPKILPSSYGEYEVRAGGHGAGTQVHWKLAATQKRVRDCLVTVTEQAARTLEERDANSSLVTTYAVTETGPDASLVRVTTTWNGASGVGGFFEKTFAPMGMRRIYDELLTNLATQLSG
jgi:hypothetical protein